MRQRAGYWSAAAGVAVVAVVAVAFGLRPQPGRPRGDVRTVSYRPAESAPRLAVSYAEVADVTMLKEFDGDSARLYLLDPLSSQVHVAVRADSGWRVERRFGGRGGGPGEFVSPTGIALLPEWSRIAVADNGRLHLFTLDGAYDRSTAPRGLCNLPAARLAAARGGVFVHGQCAQGDSVADVLFWSADGEDFQRIASDAKAALREPGVVYAASNPLAEGAGDLLFSAGVDGCSFRISTDAPPRAERTCDPDFALYRLEFTRETQRRMEARRAKSKHLADMPLPDRHPAFMHALVLPAGAALLRSWHEDSLLVRRVGETQDLAVLPLRGLVGCRRAGCLYADATTGGTRIGFISASAF